MTEHDESEEHIFEDEDQDILRSEDIGQVVEDDHQGDEPMSEEETDDPETAADIANQLTFEDDSIQGFFDHEDSVYAVAIHPENPILIASGGGDDRCYLWRADTGDKIFELTKHEDSVVALSFSSNGQFIASGGMDGKIHVSEVDTGKLVITLEGPTEVVWLKWHPRGNVILAGGEDGTVWMWNVPSGNCMAVFTGHTDSVTSGCFSPDGKMVVTTSADGSMILWDPKTGGPVSKMNAEDGRFHQGSITSLVVHPEGQLIFTGAEDGTIRLTHLAHGKILSTLSNHAESVEGLAFSDSPSHPFAVSGSVDGAICIWDLNSFSLRAQVQHESAVTKIIWQSGTPFFISSSIDQTIKKWDSRTGTCVKTWKGHQEGILDMALSSDAQLIVSGSDDGNCLVFACDQVPA